MVLAAAYLALMAAAVSFGSGNPDRVFLDLLVLGLCCTITSIERNSRRAPACNSAAMSKSEALRALDEIEELTKYLSTVGGSKKKYMAQDAEIHTAFVVIRTYLQGLPDKMDTPMQPKKEYWVHSPQVALRRAFQKLRQSPRLPFFPDP
jgi:hypothetical protein